MRTAPNTFTTKTEASRFLAAVETDLLRGTWRDDRQAPLLGDWAQRYLAAQQHRLKPKTWALYESLLRTCVLPTLGHLVLTDLQKIVIREWVAALSARPLSPSRVRQALGLLAQVLQAAVEDDLIPSNPCAGVRGPRLPDTEPVILTPEQVHALAKAAREPYDLLVELLAYAGLRIGEAFALRRRCVDLEGRRLLVEESLSETAGRLAFGPTKTHQRRTVTLPDFLLERLARHLAGLSDAPDALLFTGRTGQPLHYNAFRRWTWQPAVEAAGLVGVTPHDLRASCATWVADSAGVLEAAKRLGHARTSVTTRHYARPVVGRDRDVADGLDELHRSAQQEPGRPVLARLWHADSENNSSSA